MKYAPPPFSLQKKGQRCLSAYIRIRILNVPLSVELQFWLPEIVHVDHFACKKKKKEKKRKQLVVIDTCNIDL